MNYPWYTSGSAHLHLRVYGPLEDIWELGMLLHERTPLLDQSYRPKNGQLFFCLDQRARRLLERFYQRSGRLHQGIVSMPEIMVKYGGPQPFRLADIPMAPYRGEIGILTLRSATLGSGPLSYYRFTDTPTAEIAQQLAPFFPVYCFAAKTTQITYVAMSPARHRDTLSTLQRAFPALSINLRFDLPYESTSSVSPIQRLVHYEPYFSRKGQDANAVFGQVLRALTSGS